MRRSISATFILMLCMIGFEIGPACSTTRRSSGVDSKCPSDLLVVEAQPGAPVRLTVLDTDCKNPYFAKVEFRVDSSSTRPINRYEVHLFTSYDGKIESDSSTSLTMLRPSDSLFTKDQTRSDTFGISLKRGWFSDPKATLTLVVSTVTFADGTTWNHVSPK